MATRPNQRLTRDNSNTPDPLDPSRPLVNRPPEYRDMNRAARNQVTEHVRDAGVAAYGRPVRMQDAVNVRVRMTRRAMSEVDNGNVEAVDWYSGHTGEVREAQSGSDISVASVADAAASASQRNSPINEMAAVRSGVHRAMNPQQPVPVNERHAAAVNSATAPRSSKPFLGEEERLSPGVYRGGDLSNRQTAALNNVATQKYTSESAREVPGAKPNDLVHGEHNISSQFTDVTGRVAGRETSLKVMDNLDGKPISESWKDAPKLWSYRRGMSTASPEEDAYNHSVFSRIKDQERTPGTQGVLFTAAEETGFDPSTADTSTAEDYTMIAMTAHEAIRRSGGDYEARAAQNDLAKKVKKGPRNEGITTDITPPQAMHAFNNEATARAAKEINYRSFGPSGEAVSEHITNKALQATAWTQYRRHELGEDTEYNARQAETQNRAKAAEASAAEAKRNQGRLF